MRRGYTPEQPVVGSSPIGNNSMHVGPPVWQVDDTSPISTILVDWFPVSSSTRVWSHSVLDTDQQPVIVVDWPYTMWHKIRVQDRRKWISSSPRRCFKRGIGVVGLESRYAGGRTHVALWPRQEIFTLGISPVPVLDVACWTRFIEIGRQ